MIVKIREFQHNRWQLPSAMPLHQAATSSDAADLWGAWLPSLTRWSGCQRLLCPLPKPGASVAGVHTRGNTNMWAGLLGAVLSRPLAGPLAFAALSLAVRARGRSKVLVASTAAAKLSAVAAATGSTVVGCNAASGVRDQPIGPDETLAGAHNRLAAACSSPEARGCHLVVSIENGLVRFGTDMWIDLAVVAVRDLKTGRQVHATSSGVQFPSQSVAEWGRQGRGTVGDVLAFRSGCDRQDPHAMLTGGEAPRAALLEDAIRVALASLAAPAR